MFQYTKSILSVLTLILTFHTSQTFARELSKTRLIEIKALIKKNYCFASIDEDRFSILTGSTPKKVRPDYFFKRSKFKCIKPKDNKELLTQIAQRYASGFQIIFRKKNKFYKIENGDFSKLDKTIKKEANKKKLKKIERDMGSAELLRISKCSFCQFKLSANYVMLESSSQFSSELAWTPYYKLSKVSGIALSLATSSYIIEDDNLESTLSYALKYQIIGRYYFSHLFIEAGAGQHNFIDYDDTSMMYTVGVGNVFTRRHWFLHESIGLSGLNFQISKIDWRLDIMEYKLGIGFNF